MATSIVGTGSTTGSNRASFGTKLSNGSFSDGSPCTRRRTGSSSDRRLIRSHATAGWTCQRTMWIHVDFPEPGGPLTTRSRRTTQALSTLAPARATGAVRGAVTRTARCGCTALRPLAAPASMRRRDPIRTRRGDSLGDKHTSRRCSHPRESTTESRRSTVRAGRRRSRAAACHFRRLGRCLGRARTGRRPEQAVRDRFAAGLV